MNMINISICDDNVSFLKSFSETVEKSFRRFTSDLKITSISNGSLLLAKHKEEPFDIIFLDIDMPNFSGFDVAKRIREDISRCFIIFITSHSELVYESMDFQPFNFIRKNCNIPIDESTDRIVDKLIHHMKQNKKITLEDDISGKVVVYLKDVIYIESNKHYVLFHVLNKEEPVKIRGNIGDFEIQYEEYDFIRLHKRYLINMRFVLNIDKKLNEIVLRTIKQSLPMSKNYRKSVSEKYTLFLRSMV